MSKHNTIERISAPSWDFFQTEYILPQKPVIITNLLTGQLIQKISTLEEARHCLGDVKLKVKEEFVSFAIKNSFSVPPRQIETYTLSEYLAYIQENPQTRKICSENITPDEVRKLFEMPEYTHNHHSDRNIYSLLFVGNAGNCAHLHFDGDYRQVLLYQVFGSKRVILIPPLAAKKLNPIGNFSTCFLENFSESEKEDFVRYTGGYDCVLKPGETIFMPACIWHYLEYIDTGMSFNIRFGRNKYTQFLGDNLHLNMYLQNIAAKMIDEEVVEREYLAVFQEIKAVYNRTYKTPLQKGQYLQSLFQKISQEICPSSMQNMYHFTNFEQLDNKFLQRESERLYKTQIDPMQLLMGWNGMVNLAKH